MTSTYETTFANCIGVPYARAFWKGRVALYAILRGLEIGNDDEVILPGFTCVVVPNAVRFVGAKPVFVDIAPGTYNLDPERVERAITSRCKAILIQHTFGIPADLDRLLEIADRRRIAIIEDCAHALMSMHRGRAVGTYGTAAFFSSQWSKPYTTGLGGIAVTSSEELAERLREIQLEFVEPPKIQLARLRAQHQIHEWFFRPQFYWVAVGALRRLSDWNLFIGSSGKDELDSQMPVDTGWRMSSFQATIGQERLGSLPENLNHRSQLAELYRQRLQLRGWPVALTPLQTEPAFLRYPLRVANKWEVLQKAAESRVELGSWFESVLHPVRTSLDRFGYLPGCCPVAERTANQVLNLPLHPRVSAAEAEKVIDFVYRVGEPILS